MMCEIQSSLHAFPENLVLLAKHSKKKKKLFLSQIKSNRDPALHVKLNEKYRAFLSDHPGLTAKVTSVID